jgi:hypothetical protein
MNARIFVNREIGVAVAEILIEVKIVVMVALG